MPQHRDQIGHRGEGRPKTRQKTEDIGPFKLGKVGLCVSRTKSSQPLGAIKARRRTANFTELDRLICAPPTITLMDNFVHP